jgi:IS5 family transposase
MCSGEHRSRSRHGYSGARSAGAVSGYKNHVDVDKAHKLIRKWDATDAAVHDSQKLDDVLDVSTARKSGLDNAYRSVQVEARLKENGLQSLIHQPAARNRPLSERQKSANRRARRCAPMWSTYSGTSGGSMGGKIVRAIGIARGTKGRGGCPSGVKTVPDRGSPWHES